MLLDPLHVDPGAIAMMQDRWIVVGRAGEKIETAPDQLAKAVQMRFHAGKHVG